MGTDVCTGRAACAPGRTWSAL